jgi:hypothetical protein
MRITGETSMHRRESLIALFSFPLAACAMADPIPDDLRRRSAIIRGRKFLAQRFNERVGLLPEYAGSNVYWLYHDNYLAAKVLGLSHPDITRQIEAAIRRFNVVESGKIEILFDEVRHPLPFRHSQLIDVARVGELVIRTEVLTDQRMEGWEAYADLLLFASCALAKPDREQSVIHFRAALRMWDGQGFRDRAAEHLGRYATFKLALAQMAAHRLGKTSELPETLLDYLLKLQAEDGGWVTDYNAVADPVGKRNVETTSLAILALETVSEKGHDSIKKANASSP